jgi:hypothetical protein
MPPRSLHTIVDLFHARSDCSRVRNIGNARRRDRCGRGNPIDLRNHARVQLFWRCAVCPGSQRRPGRPRLYLPPRPRGEAFRRLALAFDEDIRDSRNGIVVGRWLPLCQ